jgi:outer membrane protein OmpA-like peptidoglycan-associated protein
VVTRSTFNSASAPKPPQHLLLETISFDFNSDQLTGDSRTDLARLAKVISDPYNEKKTYQVEGHTDQKGDPGYNRELSQRRAKSVRRFLVGQGVPSQRLRARGYGSDDLADPGHPYDEVNRRVEVVNLSQGGGL